MVVPCAGVQSIGKVLEDYARNTLPIILYALSQDSVTPEQVLDLQKVQEVLPYPVCFVRMSPVSSAGDSGSLDRGSLQKQLVSLGLLSSVSGNCACGAPSQTQGGAGRAQNVLGDSLDRLHRLLVPFARQVLTGQQVEAANRLNALHCRCLDLFINQVRMGTNNIPLSHTCNIKGQIIYPRGTPVT